MLSIWNRWVKKVDEHNAKLEYADQEEQWNYYDIFAPVLWFIVGWAFVHVIFGGIVAAICAVCMWVNWKCYE